MWTWVAGDVKTVPTLAGATLVTTGALNVRDHRFRFLPYFKAGRAIAIRLEEVKVDTTVRFSQVLPPGTAGLSQIFRWSPLKDSTVRIVAHEDILDDVQVSVFHD